MAEFTRRVATDVGGTFTDLVAFETAADGTTRIVTAKSDTTPPDYETGVLNVLRKGDIAPADVDFMAHGTTVVINALTERKGVKVGLITTQGFRDVLEIARGNRPDFFNLHYVKPEPFVPRHLRAEVPGRMTYGGEERSPLDLTGVSAILDRFRSEGVEAVAITLLHAYANTVHEEAVLEEVRRLWPEVSVVASHQITREWREYERTNTTVLSAFVQPVAARYLGRLDDGLKAQGLQKSPYIMQSNCGVDSLAATSAVPITMVESGPASGFWGAAELGKLIDEPDILALDIGGTTAKCSLIEGGEVRIMTDYWIGRSRKSAGYPIMVPVVDLVEIGNGGGSIAWVDDFGKLHVGPQSAGAVPGPAAYGKGGTEATTTDANLWLGRINRDYFCGGEVVADMTTAEAALRAVGDKLGVTVDEAAEGIIRIANNNMVNALKLVSLNRGHDTRDFTFLAFGGGGGMHAVALGQELQVKKVVVPNAASVFSAWGMMMSDLRRDYFVTQLVDLDAGASNVIEAVFAEAEAKARATFTQEGVDPGRVSFLRYGKFRYQNQEHTTEVPLEGPVTDSDLTRIAQDFHALYEKEYTYRLDAPVEMVGIHLVARAEVGKLEMVPADLGPSDASPARKGRRTVDYAPEGTHEADIYDGEKLMPGMAFIG
ncbi:MAG: hydantoinase/oxoprolinase family protein, partial [Alphaproteobacteria bacterium]|nr:hydantoinase/oxoprolinase family protein [Alphaproteobacteria bacterium]